MQEKLLLISQHDDEDKRNICTIFYEWTRWKKKKILKYRISFILSIVWKSQADLCEQINHFQIEHDELFGAFNLEYLDPNI